MGLWRGGGLDAGWEVVLVEPEPSGARNAKRRGLENVICGTTHSAGFQNESLPAIGVFDVVFALGLFHHLHDEQFKTALSEVRRVLRTGGVFIDLDNLWPTRITRITAFIVRWLEHGKHVRSLTRQREMISEFFPDLSEFVGTYSCCALEFVRFIGKNQK